MNNLVRTRKDLVIISDNQVYILFWYVHNFFLDRALVYLDGTKFIFPTWNVERPFSKIGQFVKVKLPVTTSFRFSQAAAMLRIISYIDFPVVSCHDTN